MDQQLAVIVGVGPGVSLAVARRFAREGFQLALIARNAEALSGHVRELAQGGARAFGFPADASKPDSLREAFGEIQGQLGAAAVLVYNAAMFVPGRPSVLDVGALAQSLAVNVTGALVSAQQVIPQMRQQRRGTILFTGGGLALDPAPDAAALAIGKAGLRNLTYSLGTELEGDGIHVATVTIAGTVRPGSHFDPDQIAEVYWQLHTEAPGRQQREVVYR